MHSVFIPLFCKIVLFEKHFLGPQSSKLFSNVWNKCCILFVLYTTSIWIKFEMHDEPPLFAQFASFVHPWKKTLQSQQSVTFYYYFMIYISCAYALKNYSCTTTTELGKTCRKVLLLIWTLAPSIIYLCTCWSVYMFSAQLFREVYS